MKRFGRWLRSRWLDVTGLGIGGIVIAVVFFIILPSIANYRDVWAAVRNVSWPWILAMTLSAVLNVLTFAPPYMAALPGLRFRPALTNSLAATASTFIAPGGPAVGMGLSFAMFRAWGFPPGAITLAVTLTVVWNMFVTFGLLPSLSFVVLTLSGGSNSTLPTLAVIGTLVFAGSIAGFTLVLISSAAARSVGDLAARAASSMLRVVRRHPVSWSGESWVRFRADTLDLLRRRWHWLTLATLLNHVTVYITLVVSLRALGVSGSDVSLPESFAAWTISRVIGAIPITPGGFGLVEVGLTGALVAFGGSSSEVVAAVLVYRFFTVAPPLVLGVLAGATWRRHHPGWTEDAAASSTA